MAMFNSGYNPNQPMINQLMRQRDNIENMLAQYNSPQMQAPVQNIINTGMGTEFEAKILNDDEDIDSIFINKKTMFLDKKNRKVVIKELDGKISEEYEIVIPLNAKDKKILELENRLKDMERRLNDESTKSSITSNEQQESITNGNESIESTTKTSSKSISKSTK